MPDMVERAVDRASRFRRPDLADGDDEIACGYRILVHFRGFGEARKPDLRDVPAGQPVLDQRANRIAVAEAFVRRACRNGHRA